MHIESIKEIKIINDYLFALCINFFYCLDAIVWRYSYVRSYKFFFSNLRLKLILCFFFLVINFNKSQLFVASGNMLVEWNPPKSMRIAYNNELWSILCARFHLKWNNGPVSCVGMPTKEKFFISKVRHRLILTPMPIHMYRKWKWLMPTEPCPQFWKCF